MNAEAGSLVIVTTAVGSRSDAARLAGALLESRLAACVQYHAIRSVYRWKGRVERASEFLLAAKTRKSLAGRLAALIRARHTYEVPEILVMPVAEGLAEYARWVLAETETAADRGRGRERQRAPARRRSPPA